MASDRQHTLAKSVSMTGTSLHTGEQVTLTLQPAPENFGFKFRRMDLEDKPFIAALAEKVQKVERATTIAEGGVNVHTVEHVISALAGMGVDNAIIASEFINCKKIIGMHYDTFGYIKIDQDEAFGKFAAAGKELLLLQIGNSITI